MSIVYDAGVLIAADRNERACWADHRVRLELGLPLVVTAPVVAQVSRSTRQVSLHRLLAGMSCVPFDPAQAHPVGRLLAAAGTSDVVDAHIVATAAEIGATIITNDGDDLSALANSIDADRPKIHER